MTQSIKRLAKAFLENQDSEEMIDFLRGILTSKELSELSTRLEIVKMLKQGVPQHTIAEELGVGVATVTRGSKELQQGRFKNV
jgi:TrpR family trp operon transcriptional repressor